MSASRIPALPRAPGSVPPCAGSSTTILSAARPVAGFCEFGGVVVDADAGPGDGVCECTASAPSKTPANDKAAILRIDRFMKFVKFSKFIRGTHSRIPKLMETLGPAIALAQ